MNEKKNIEKKVLSQFSSISSKKKAEEKTKNEQTENAKIHTNINTLTYLRCAVDRLPVYVFFFSSVKRTVSRNFVRRVFLCVCVFVCYAVRFLFFFCFFVIILAFRRLFEAENRCGSVRNHI